MSDDDDCGETSRTPPRVLILRAVQPLGTTLEVIVAGVTMQAIAVLLATASAIVRPEASAFLPNRLVVSRVASPVTAPVRTPSIQMADVLERPPEIKLAPQQPAGDEMNARGKKYKVLLFNDNVNKREFVARALVSTIPEMTEAIAYTVMQKAHTHGFAVCGVWVYELAEAYCDGLKVCACVCPPFPCRIPFPAVALAGQRLLITCRARAHPHHGVPCIMVGTGARLDLCSRRGVRRVSFNPTRSPSGTPHIPWSMAFHHSGVSKMHGVIPMQ